MMSQPGRGLCSTEWSAGVLSGPYQSEPAGRLGEATSAQPCSCTEQVEGTKPQGWTPGGSGTLCPSLYCSGLYLPLGVEIYVIVSQAGNKCLDVRGSAFSLSASSELGKVISCSRVWLSSIRFCLFLILSPKFTNRQQTLRVLRTELGAKATVKPIQASKGLSSLIAVGAEQSSVLCALPALVSHLSKC